MALKAMADNGINITCQEDARLYDYLAGQNMDYVMRGIGDAFKITQSSTTLLVKLGSGECVIQGRHITNTNSTDVTLTLPQNSNGYLVLRYDLSQSSGNEVSFAYASVLEDDDLNNAGVKRDIALGKYITNEAGVSSFTDLRNYETKFTGMLQIRKITLPTSGWSANKTSIAVNGITSTDTPLIALDLSAVSDVAEKQTQKQEWSKIIDAQTRDGYIDFWCSEVPTVELKLIVKGV